MKRKKLPSVDGSFSIYPITACESQHPIAPRHTRRGARNANNMPRPIRDRGAASLLYAHLLATDFHLIVNNFAQKRFTADDTAKSALVAVANKVNL